MKKAKLVTNVKCNINAVLKKAFGQMLGSEVYVKETSCDDKKMTVYIGEDYYFRTNSTLTLTVIVEETPEQTTVELISGGGKVGLFGISYGAESSAVNKVVNLLRENGFREVFN